MVAVRQRSWTKQGVRQTAVVVDYVDIDGYRRQQTFNSERAAEMFAEAIQVALLNEAPRNSMRIVKATPAVVAPSASAGERPVPKDIAHAVSPLAQDLVWGVAAIAVEIGRNPRQTFHMLEQGKLPAKKIGGRWCASRSGLSQFFTAGIM